MSKRQPVVSAGVARVQKGGIDLVVTDVRMPDLDGLDMLREIKSAPLEQPPHVIVDHRVWIDRHRDQKPSGLARTTTSPSRLTWNAVSCRRESAGRARSAA